MLNICVGFITEFITSSGAVDLMQLSFAIDRFYTGI